MRCCARGFRSASNPAVEDTMLSSRTRTYSETRAPDHDEGVSLHRFGDFMHVSWSPQGASQFTSEWLVEESQKYLNWINERDIKGYYWKLGIKWHIRVWEINDPTEMIWNGRIRLSPSPGYFVNKRVARGEETERTDRGEQWRRGNQ